MPFNLAANKKVKSFDRLLEDARESGSLSVDENPSTHEDLLDENRKDKDGTMIIESDFCREDKELNKIIEKKLKHEKAGEILVPSINSFVKDIEDERRKAWKEEENIVDKDHWTLKETTQNADLSEWPKMTLQKKASIDNVVKAVKIGETSYYDDQILIILKKANSESRELTQSEKEEISKLKIARTKAFA